MDLFAGCGGLTRGFHDASTETLGFEVVAAVEHDIMAAATYAANFGRDRLHVLSIEDWRDNDIPDADVVVGGPPCQGFSTLGKQDPEDKRNLLWREYMRVLIRVQPRWFVMENVAAFFKSQQWAMLQEEANSGSLTDYELHHYVLNAADYGVPQVRRRAVVVARRRDVRMPDEPRRTHSRDQWLTVAEELHPLVPFVPPGHVSLPGGRFGIKGVEVPGSFKTAELHVTRSYESTSLERFAHIPKGGNRTNLPERLQSPCWRRHKSGSMDVMGRLYADRPSVTIRTEFFKPEKGRYLHPSENRALTLAEGALLQTFDLGDQWCGSKVAIARQIGNAVPVRLGTALARTIADAALAHGPSV